MVYKLPVRTPNFFLYIEQGRCFTLSSMSREKCICGISAIYLFFSFSKDANPMNVYNIRKQSKFISNGLNPKFFCFVGKNFISILRDNKLQKTLFKRVFPLFSFLSTFSLMHKSCGFHMGCRQQAL